MMLPVFENDVLAAFIIFQIVFLFLDIYIYSKTNRDIARKREYTFFGILILIHIFYLILNSVWTLGEYGVLDLPRQVTRILVTCSLCTITGTAYIFFLFVSERIRFVPSWRFSFQCLSLLPEGLSLILILSSPWTGLAFSLNEKNQLIHGPFYSLMLLSSSLYLVLVAAFTGYNMLTEKTSAKRRSSAAVFFSVLLLMVFVVIDDMMDQSSILPAAIFAVIIVVFINLLESNINSDALTGMNNRRRAMDYLSDQIGNVSEDHPLYLYIGDLNAFKSINDLYGHLEGDEALILCSRTLKITAARYNGFTARFGGDEFLITWKPEKREKIDPEALIEEVNSRLSGFAEEMKKPYSLTMSMGYVCCTNRRELVNTYLEKADSMLYERKKEFHRQAKQ